MKKILFTLTLTLSLQAYAVNMTQICEMLNVSREVWIYVPTVQDPQFAECLRIAKVNFNRKIQLITVPYFNQLENSYTYSLGMAGVTTYELNVNSKESVLIIDGYTFKGHGIGMYQNATINTLNPKQNQILRQWFKNTTRAIKPLNPIQLAQAFIDQARKGN